MIFYFLLWLNVTFTVSFVLGLRMVTDIGKVGYPLHILVKETFGDYWGKPILLCAPCMPSFWSCWTTFMIFLPFHAEMPWFAWIGLYVCTAICSSFPAGFLWTLFNKL